MRIGLVTPMESASRVDPNPGCTMITAGIRWLLRKADPSAEFVEVELDSPWTKAEHKLARTCDMLAICGNPRFDTGDHDWLYAGAIQQALDTGLPVVDLYGGSCVHHGEETPLRTLSESPRNRRLIEIMKGLRAVVVRDELAFDVAFDGGLNPILLPCSAWWAAKEFGIERREPERRIVIPVRYARMRHFVRNAGDREVIAIMASDAQWCAHNGIPATFVRGARALMEVLAECESVVSYRVHAAIPAASIGAPVVMAGIDSRIATCEPFGIACDEYHRRLPEPAVAHAPEVDPVPALRAILEGIECRR